MQAMRRPALVAVLAFAACGESSSTPDAAPPAADAAIDGAPDAGGFTSCEGACRTTALTAAFGATTRQLDRAHYGVTASATGATLHVEAYRGGGTGCPTTDSPTPSYTLVLGTVPVPTSTAPSTSPGSLLDFQGDLLTSGVIATATAVTLTPVAASVCTTCVGMAAPSDPDGFVALDVALTFPDGTVTGHLFATHCDSLDAQE